jgi:hypothetical protein
VWGLKKNFALLELLERLQNGASNQLGVAEESLKGMGEVGSSYPCPGFPSVICNYLKTQRIGEGNMGLCFDLPVLFIYLFTFHHPAKHTFHALSLRK